MHTKLYTILVLCLFLLTACEGNTVDNPSYADASVHISAPGETSPVEVFNGKVFVFTTTPDTEEWLAAGWQIDELSIDTDNQEIPLDCTLHPHAGVAGQWVGGCSGNVRVPTRGAMHIAVMLEDGDGGFQVIQVAPEPAYP